MANKVAIGFNLSFIGDGSSLTLVVTAATGPFDLKNPVAQTMMANSFSLASTIPTGIQVSSLGCNGGLTVTASILVGIITFTFSSAPIADQLYLISGIFTF